MSQGRNTKSEAEKGRDSGESKIREKNVAGMLFEEIVDICSTLFRDRYQSKSEEEERTKLGPREIFTLDTAGNSTQPDIRRIRFLVRPDHIYGNFDLDGLVELSNTNNREKQLFKISETEAKILKDKFNKLQNLSSELITSIDLANAGTSGEINWKSKSSHDVYEEKTYETYAKIHTELIKNAVIALKKQIQEGHTKFNIIDGGCGSNPLLFKFKTAVEEDPELSKNKNLQFKWLGFDFSYENVIACNKLLKDKPDLTDVTFVEGDLTEMDELIKQQKENETLFADGVTVGCFSGTATRLVLYDALQCLDVLQSMAKAKIEASVFSGWAELLFRKFQAKRIGYDSEFDTGAISYLHPIVTLHEKSLADKLQYYVSRLTKDPTFLDLSLSPSPVEILRELINNKTIDFNKIMYIDLSFCDLTAESSKMLGDLIVKNFKNPDLHVNFYHHRLDAIANFPISTLVDKQFNVRLVTDELYLMGSPNFFERLAEHFILPSFTSTRKGTILNDIYESLEKITPEDRSKYKKEIDICYHILVDPSYNTLENNSVLKSASEAGFVPATQVLNNLSKFRRPFRDLRHPFEVDVRSLNDLGIAIYQGDPVKVAILLKKGVDFWDIGNLRSRALGRDLNSLTLALSISPKNLTPEKRNEIINILLTEWSLHNESDAQYQKNYLVFAAILLIKNSSRLIPIIKNLREQGANLSAKFIGLSSKEVNVLELLKEIRGSDFFSKDINDSILEKLLDPLTPDDIIKKLLDPTIPKVEKEKILAPTEDVGQIRKTTLYSTNATLFESQISRETKKEIPPPSLKKKSD